MIVKVYRTHRAARAHFDPECPAYVRSGKALRPLQAVEISDLYSVRFCQTCAGDVPYPPATHHTICDECSWGRPMPCRHNGGVPVLIVQEFYQSGRFIRRVNTRWRWPENALGAPLARDKMLV